MGDARSEWAVPGLEHHLQQLGSCEGVVGAEERGCTKDRHSIAEREVRQRANGWRVPFPFWNIVERDIAPFQIWDAEGSRDHGRSLGTVPRATVLVVRTWTTGEDVVVEQPGDRIAGPFTRLLLEVSQRHGIDERDRIQVPANSPIASNPWGEFTGIRAIGTVVHTKVQVVCPTPALSAAAVDRLSDGSDDLPSCDDRVWAEASVRDHMAIDARKEHPIRATMLYDDEPLPVALGRSAVPVWTRKDDSTMRDRPDGRPRGVTDIIGQVGGAAIINRKPVEAAI